MVVDGKMMMVVVMVERRRRDRIASQQEIVCARYGALAQHGCSNVLVVEVITV